MQPRDFLAAVLPLQGYYCVAELSTPAKEHVFATNIDDLMVAVNRFNEAKHDTYFALSAFRENINRTAANAAYVRSAFLDIEGAADSHYKSKAEVAAAVDAFLDATPLGALGVPWIVSSGGGLHFYWPFTEDIPIKVWKPVAESFKRLCKKHGLVIDFSVTADAARVLRMPGTTNWKKKYATPRPCEIKYVGGTFKFSEFAEAVRMPLNGAELHDEEPIPGVNPAPGAPVLSLVDKNMSVSFRKLLDKGCKQIEYYCEHATEDGMEPLWRGILSLCKVCSDAEKAAKIMTKMHPYTTQRMKTKLREILGPYPCKKFDSENPGVCESCEHWGKITNPLALGRELLTDNSPKEITLTNLHNAETYTIQRPDLPYGFYYGKAGGIIADVVYGRGTKNEQKEQKQILPYDFFAYDILNDQGSHYLHMKAMRSTGVEELAIPTKLMNSRDRLLEYLHEHNIATKLSDNEHVHKYLNHSYVNLSERRVPTQIPTTLGWQEDDTFAYNGMIYTPKKETAVPMPNLVNITQHTKQTGTLSGWQQAMNMMVVKNLDDMLMISALGFGAPLMRFTGLSGVLFHTSSTESGTGKSLSLEMAASVWGDPKSFPTADTTSDVALENRLGLLHSLPLCVDEVTNKSNINEEWVPNFLLSVSRGHGKERMVSAANMERINTTSWQAPVIMNSNKNMCDYLTGARERSSQGELRRLLEVYMPLKMGTSIEEDKVLAYRFSNFGVAGHKYAQWLVRNRALAEEMTVKFFESLRRDFNSSGEERFWTAGAAIALAGAVLAGPKYANVFEYPVQRIHTSIHRLILGMRDRVTTNIVTGDDVLHHFIENNFGQFVIMNKTGVSSVTNLPTMAASKTTTRSRVAGRVESGITPNMKRVFIATKRLKAACVSHNVDFEIFRRSLSERYDVKYLKKDLLLNTGGPSLRVDCVEIDMPDTEIPDIPE